MNRMFLGTLGIALVGAGLLAIACGGDDGDDSHETVSERPAVVMVQASKVKFQPESISVKIDVPFELRLENLDRFEHDLQVAELPVEVLEGGSTRPEHMGADGHGGGRKLAVHTGAREIMSGVFVARERGIYDFWCTIAGHKEQGMTGTITVE